MFIISLNSVDSLVLSPELFMVLRYSGAMYNTTSEQDFTKLLFKAVTAVWMDATEREVAGSPRADSGSFSPRDIRGPEVVVPEDCALLRIKGNLFGK
jgi:hypothetical protein